MKRLAGCLVVSFLASAAAWGGCRDDLGYDLQGVVGGSGTDADIAPDGIVVVTGDAILIGSDGSDGSGVPDAPTMGSDGSGEGGVPDAMTMGSDGSGEGGVPDAMTMGSDGSGEGGVPDAMTMGSDGDGSGTGAADASGTGDALRTSDDGSSDRTSFYACAGGPASTGIEIGLPIGLALAVAVRRRRRWRSPGAA